MTIFSDRAHAKAERLALRLAKRFSRDEEGATAVEFAIVSLPFFALLFGIMELALVFFTSSTLVHATSEAGRVIRTGNFQSCGLADEFKALVCSNMNWRPCMTSLRVDVITGASFKSIAVPVVPPPPTVVMVDGKPVTPPTPNGQFDTTVAGDPLVVRSTVHYRLILPPLLTRLDDPKGSGTRTLVATTAFRNEPFPASNTCDPNVSDALSAAAGS